MSRAEKIRYHILRILRNTPMHGYSLYTLLQEKNLVKNPSELYKLLKSMEKRGFLNPKEEESAHGPTRKIYSLTKEGEKKYMDLAFESASIFMELIIEFTLNNILELILSHFEPTIGNLEDMDNKHIFINFSGLPKYIQRIIYIRLSSKIAQRNLVYCEGLTRDQLMDDVAKTLRFIGPNMLLKPNSLDYYFTLNLSLQANVGQIQRKIKEIIQMLKPTGSFVLFIPQLMGQDKPDFLLQSLKGWIQQNFNQEYLSQVELFPFAQNFEIFEKFPKLSEIRTFLNQFFEEINEIDHNRLKMIILSKPKKQE